MNIEINRVDKSRIADVDFDHLEFGLLFADHMAQMIYTDGVWGQPEIKPCQDISFHPSMSALHYGQSVFEGIKAFSTESGQVNIFRVPDHVRRLNFSCERMCMPALPEKDVIQLISVCVDMDRQWVPKQQGSALYLRPFVFGMDPFIGMRPSENYRMLMIASPVGPYYKNCLEKPIKLVSSEEFVRAVVGGTGQAKTAGNYAASMLPAKLAKEQGYDQVLWLDGKESRYIDEVGTMNIFFVIKDTLVTPPLYGAVLDGITRRSIIALAKDWGVAVEERQIDIHEILDGVDEGSVQECFGTGTAAVLSPIGEIKHGDCVVHINQGQTGPLTQQFREAIMGIQYGIQDDVYGWNYLI